jgi:hypothetical protein
MAIVAAPLAGGAAAFLATFLISFFGDRQVWKDTFTASSALGFWALIICCAYTLVVGTLAFLYARLRHRPPTLATAIVVAVAVGVIPWTVASWSEPTFLGKLAFPALAALCAVATAWTFWRVAFGGRADVVSATIP